MNKYILLVMKWLKNPESVTQEELKANRDYAWDDADDDAYDAYADAATATAYGDTDDAQYWVDVYFKRSGENKADYENELLCKPTTATETTTESIQEIIDYIDEGRTNIKVVRELLKLTLQNIK